MYFEERCNWIGDQGEGSFNKKRTVTNVKNPPKYGESRLRKGPCIRQWSILFLYRRKNNRTDWGEVQVEHWGKS